jgi:hypothetical protein
MNKEISNVLHAFLTFNPARSISVTVTMRYGAVVVTVLLTCFAAHDVVAGCWYDQQIATVCTEWDGGRSCHTEIYYYEYCTVGGGGSTTGVCGYRVRVRHFDGTYSTYCHMVDGSTPLQTGASVKAGATRIGSADSTGSSTGDHVHITYLDNDMNNAGEYFGATDSQPASSQLNAGGC